MFIVFAIGFLPPTGLIMQVFSVAPGSSVTIELLLVYQAPSSDAIWRSWLDALALGDATLWRDIVCYTVGMQMAGVMGVVFRGSHLSACWPITQCRRTRGAICF